MLSQGRGVFDTVMNIMCAFLSHWLIDGVHAHTEQGNRYTHTHTHKQAHYFVGSVFALVVFCAHSVVLDAAWVSA